MNISSQPDDIDVEKQTGRVEAFSDGVFSIAITLLVLDIKVPRDLPADTHLATALMQQWPIYVAFLTSFATIGIMWINHHRLLRLIRRVDHWFLVFNGLLLLGVTLVPFPTSLLAEYARNPAPDSNVAALIYSALLVFISIAYNLIWIYASRNNRLLDRRAAPEWIRAVTVQYRYGPLLYLVSCVLALIFVPACTIMNILLATYFLLPQRPIPGQPIDTP